MSRKCDDWLTRIKAVERDYSAARFAIDRLWESARSDPTVLRGVLDVRHLAQAGSGLEATYFIRLFAVFEGGLRDFWQVLKPGRTPRTEHLLDGLASARGIPNDLLVNTHAVRRCRNSLVHEQGEEIEPIPLATARGHLCKFFSRLPPTW
jgi:hypothetical protein